MKIRHCVEESNIDENYMVIDPNKIRHVVVSGGKIHSMSGLVDPASHINLDYSLHRVTECIVAEKFEIGADVKIEDRGLVFALVGQSSYGHYGNIDYTQRLCDMIDKVKDNIKTSNSDVRGNMQKSPQPAAISSDDVEANNV